jgi:hypothetical protein
MRSSRPRAGGVTVLVLTVLGVGVSLALAFVGLRAFERYTAGRFGHRFFTTGYFLGASAALGCTYAGYYWWTMARESGGDELNGLALMGLGAAIVLGIVIRNIRRTGVVIGTCGTLLQVLLFGVVGSFGVVAFVGGLVIGFVGVVAMSAGASPVYVVNRW